MQVTSDSQFRAAETDSAPELEQVRDGIYCLGMEFPGFKPHATLSYLVLATDGVHIIDPGWDSDSNWARLQATLKSLGSDGGEIRSVTVTHLHPDHLGMANRVRRNTGATVALHSAEQTALDELREPPGAEEVSKRLESWGVPANRWPELEAAIARRSAWQHTRADLLLEDGDRLAIPGFDFRVLHTPGHTTGHISLVAEPQGLIFTGDHLLPNQFSGIGLGGSSESNPISDYLESLSKLAPFNDFEVAPGHGYRFYGIQERGREIAEHHLKRAAEVEHERNSQGETATLWQIAETLSWTDGWQNLAGLTLLSALAQTELHLNRISPRPN